MLKSFAVLLLLVSVSLSMPKDGLGQTDSILNSFNDTTTIKREEHTTQAPTIMDKKWNRITTKYFTMNIGLAVLLDHNILSQDSDNITQVGKVEPGTEFRGDRFIFSGSLLFFPKNPWRYMVSINFNGLDAPEGKKSLDFVDWNVDIPISKTAGWFTIGKQKEGVGLEYISPGTQGMFMERGSGAPMFVRQRNIGIRYSNVVLQQKLTYTIGVFNNYWETGKSFSDNGTQFAARVSGLPVYKSDRDLMHVGVGYRYSGATSGKMTFKAKPEANTAPTFINTGAFDAEGAGTLLLEWIGVNGPFSAVAEYMYTSVNSSVKGNPNFTYFQAGGSWFITGENRRYNKTTGNLGKLVPNKNFKFRKGTGPGALELGARYTHSSATDAGVAGGEFNRFTTALSWYPNAHFRYEINYGFGRLLKDKISGNVNFWQFRVQFEL